MSRTAIRGSSWRKLPPPPSISHDRNKLLQTVAADPCLSSPFPAHLPQLSTHWKSTQETGTFCHFCRKARPAKTRQPPPLPNLILPSVTPLHLCLLLKAKIKPLGYLGGGGLGLGTPDVGSGEAARVPSRARAGARAVTWEQRAGRQVSLAAPVPTLLTAARQEKWQI